MEIILVVKDDEAILTVRDDGKGISTEEIKSAESLGLIGMRERAMLINGRLTVIGIPGKGTTVTVTVPLQPTRTINDEYLVS